MKSAKWLHATSLEGFNTGSVLGNWVPVHTKAKSYPKLYLRTSRDIPGCIRNNKCKMGLTIIDFYLFTNLIKIKLLV